MSETNVGKKKRHSFLPLEMLGSSCTTPATNRTWQNWLSVCISSDTLHSSEGHPAEQVRVRVLLTLPQALPSQESAHAIGRIKVNSLRILLENFYKPSCATTTGRFYHDVFAHPSHSKVLVLQ
jgi:hypothetical protein